jgi:hypothetical protein
VNKIKRRVIGPDAGPTLPHVCHGAANLGLLLE